MREIGTVASEKAAQTLADYLLTQNITTRLVPKAKGDGWIVWVHREERLPEARQALEDFNRNPDDPKFVSAAPTAKQIRKKAEKVEAGYRKRIRDFRDRWEGPIYYRAPLSFGLMLTSVVVFGLLQFMPLVYLFLSFSMFGLDENEALVDTGFAAILHGQVWRLVTPIFIHFGLPHLFFNMMTLLAFGERIEFRKGTWRFAVLVLVSAVTSNVGQYLHHGGSFGGMSGVVFALAGYLWIKGKVHPEDYLKLEPSTVNWVLGWLVLGFVFAQISTPEQKLRIPLLNMANVAHAVGLGTGMLFGYLKF